MCIDIGTAFDVLIAMPPQHHHAFVPVLFIGSSQSHLAVGLREHGIGVIVAERVERGMRLLKDFRVVAVVYDVPELQPLPELVATGTRVILLAAGEAAWDDDGVIVLRRDAPVAAVAGAIQRIASQRATAKV